MTYIAGTAPAGLVARTWHETILKPALLAEGFEFVEEVLATPGDSTSAMWKVFRSPGTLNASGVDWFLYLYSNSSTHIESYYQVSEAWDATTKKMLRGIPASTSTPLATGEWNNTGLLVSSWSTAMYTNYTIPATGFNYWLRLSIDWVIFAIRNGPTDGSALMGLIDTAVPAIVTGSGPYGTKALCMWRMANSTNQANPVSAGGGFTREPNTTTNLSTNFAALTSPDSTPYRLGPSAQDTLYQLAPMVSRVALFSCRNNNVPRGMLPAEIVYSSASGTSALVNGDTLTIDGLVYVRMGQGSGFYVRTT